MRPYALIQSVDAAWIPYLALTYAHHADYASRCGADYLTFTGVKEEGLHPSWNRIPLLKDALKAGYEKVVWLDADTLVTDLSHNIFTETEPDVPFQMVQQPNVRWFGDDHYNSGVMVVHQRQEALEALHWVWDQRQAPLRAHHVPTFWEQNWISDYVHEHPACIKTLAQRWNWHRRFSPAQEPIYIQGWHGEPNRLALVTEAVQRVSGHPLDADQMPAEDWLPGDPWQRLDDGRYYPVLTQLIRQWQVTSVVEIGVRAGYSMAAMLRGNPRLTYLGLDVDQPNPSGGLSGGLTHAERLRDRYAHGTVTLMHADSQALQTLPEGHFDLAYIDGNHDEAACAHDLALVAPYCDRILVDDYHPLLAVRQAVQAFARQHRIPLERVPRNMRFAVLDLRRAGQAPRNQRFWENDMTYLCVAAAPQYHRILGTLEPGQTYEFRDAQEAPAEACVKNGILQHLEEIPLPNDDEEMDQLDADDPEDSTEAID